MSHHSPSPLPTLPQSQLHPQTSGTIAAGSDKQGRIDWLGAIPYIAIHLMCLGVFFVGRSCFALGTALFLYSLRVFVLTAFYHRYFSHRSFKTSRICQFIFGTIGCMALQRGPLWWAAHHRHHHVHSDDPVDLHSPRQQGFWWSHFGWFLTPDSRKTNLKIIPDFAKFPELRLLERHYFLPAVFLAAMLYGLGAFMAVQFPALEVDGMQMLIWGFFVSTVCVYHVTYLVNSATHVFGRRRFITKDDSRNNLLIALLTFGEGWHNNHHHYPNSARQGFYWWEIDITYYILKVMSWCGLVWNLHPVPAHVLHKNLNLDSKSS